MLAAASISGSFHGEAKPEDAGRMAWLIWLSAVTNYLAKAAESFTTFPFMGGGAAIVFPPVNGKMRIENGECFTT
jgi:hypothetical protein